MRTAPEGWYHEPADHSVGIFGELLLHQCGTEDEAVEVGTDQSTADGVVGARPAGPRFKPPRRGRTCRKRRRAMSEDQLATAKGKIAVQAPTVDNAQAHAVIAIAEALIQLNTTLSNVEVRLADIHAALTDRHG